METIINLIKPLGKVAHSGNNLQKQVRSIPASNKERPASINRPAGEPLKGKRFTALSKPIQHNIGHQDFNHNHQQSVTRYNPDSGPYSLQNNLEAPLTIGDTDSLLESVKPISLDSLQYRIYRNSLLRYIIEELLEQDRVDEALKITETHLEGFERSNCINKIITNLLEQGHAERATALQSSYQL